MPQNTTTTTTTTSYPLLLTRAFLCPLLLLLLFAPPQTAADDSFPQPFDSTKGYQLSPSCSTFFQSLADDKVFMGCRAFSFLLPNSLAFAQQSRVPAQIQSTMDQMCNSAPTPQSQCEVLMASYALQIKQQGVCKAEMNAKNTFVTQAYVAFRTYDVMQTVGCLRNATGTNCYIDALGVRTVGLSMFYLANGVPLSSGSVVPCSDCNQRIMDTFAANGLSDPSLPLLTTFGPVANYLNSACGAGFVRMPAGATAGAAAQGNSAQSTASRVLGWWPVGWCAIALSALAFL